MSKFTIVTVDADGESDLAVGVDSKFLEKFFGYLIEDADILEVGAVVTVKVVE